MSGILIPSPAAQAYPVYLISIYEARTFENSESFPRSRHGAGWAGAEMTAVKGIKGSGVPLMLVTATLQPSLSDFPPNSDNGGLKISTGQTQPEVPF